MKVGEPPSYKIKKASSPAPTSGNPQREERGYDHHGQSEEPESTDERRPKTGIGDNVDYLA